MYFNNSFHFKDSFFLFFHSTVSSPIAHANYCHVSRGILRRRRRKKKKVNSLVFCGISRLVMALKAWNGTRHVRSRGYEGKSVARITYVLASRILTLKVKEVGVGNADEQTTCESLRE